MLAAAAATIIGGGISAYGQLQQGKAALSEAQYQAQIIDNNAIAEGYAAIADQQQLERDRAALASERFRNQESQKAAAAKSGITISGSVVDVLTDSAIESEKDIQQLKYNSELSRWNATNKIKSLAAERNLTLIAGKNAKKASKFAAAGTMISSIGQAAGMYAASGGFGGGKTTGLKVTPTGRVTSPGSTASRGAFLTRGVKY